MNYSRNERRALERENGKQPLTLHQVPRNLWPTENQRLLEVWRSKEFLVQIYQEDNNYKRLSVCRSSIDQDNLERWKDGISWEDLMRVKRECGRGAQDALEIYPADRDITNVANMRHLWLPPEPVPFAWRHK